MEVINEQTGEFEIMPALPASALEAQTRGEIDIQISTAKRFPRSITKFKQEIGSLALLDQETAAACIYALPRDGKSVEGPSARFAEIVASCWGHMRIQTRVASEDDHFITLTGIAWDLERNVAKSVDVRRRITKKNGQKYNDDMIVVASNAGGSIASRNAVLQTVPRAYWWPTYLACRKAAVGDQKTLAGRRADALDYFQKMGIERARVFALLGVAGVDDITSEHVLTLVGLATAIKEGDTNIDDAFPVAGKGGDGNVVQMPRAKTSAPPATTPAAPTPAAPPASTSAPSSGSAPAPRSPAPTPSAPVPAAIAPTQGTHRIVKVEERKSQNGRAYYLITTEADLTVHTWSSTVAGDAGEAKTNGRAVTFQGKPTSFGAAPFQVTGIVAVEEREPGSDDDKF